jgi:hypothetical protein
MRRREGISGPCLCSCGQGRGQKKVGLFGYFQSIWIRVEPNKPLGGIELNYCSIEAISMLYYVYFILRKDSNRTP